MAKPVVKDYDCAFMPREFISTWNNYTDDDEARWKQWCESVTTYSVVGHETGESGTPHLQGFHQMKQGRRFAAFKKKFPKVHIHPVKVNNGANEYCKKDGNYWETGTFSQKAPGSRTDLTAIAEQCASGKSFTEIAKENPEAVLRYPQGMKTLVQIHEKPRDRSIPKRCVCLYGPTGTGKTKRVFDWCDSHSEGPYVWDNGMPTWWDGYCGQKCVIMDEYRAHLPMSYLLRLMDRYPMRVQYKGGSTQFVSDVLLFTSSKHPRDWYPDQPDDKVSQLLRRFDAILEVTHIDQLISLEL